MVAIIYHLRGGDVGQTNRCRVKCGRPRCNVEIRILNANDGREWHNAYCSFKRCTGCFEVCYCSRECKRLDWDDHKNLCRYWRTCKRQSACPTSSIVDYDIQMQNGDVQPIRHSHRGRCTCGSDSCH